MRDTPPISPAPEGTYELRYHNAMPGWCKIIGLNIKAIDKCEGGGFAIAQGQAEVICMALNRAASTGPDEAANVPDEIAEIEKRLNIGSDSWVDARRDRATLIAHVKRITGERDALATALEPFAHAAKSYEDFVAKALPCEGVLVFPCLDNDGGHYLITLDEEDFRRAAEAWRK